MSDDGPQTPPAASPGGMPKGIQLALGALIVFGLLGWFGYTNLESGSTFTYYQTLDEFRASGVRPDPGVSLRVHGYVANESIERDLASKHVVFGVQNDPPHAATAASTPMRVIYRSLEVPDLFQDGAEVVVEGHLAQENGEEVFVADNVLAKCPSKFQAKAEGAEI